MGHYWTCPICGANLDLGESCDCNQDTHSDSDKTNFKEDEQDGSNN